MIMRLPTKISLAVKLVDTESQRISGRRVIRVLGPIVIMIENYRSGLLWDLFMSRTDVKAGLVKLGFNDVN